MERVISNLRVCRISSIILFLVGSAALSFSQNSQQAPTAEPHRRILVSIPHRKLAFLEDDNVIKIFPVAVGANVSPSPAGEFEIATRVSNPTYYHPGVVIPTGKDNPIGTRWIGLNKNGYGIHGTNVPSSIGHAASHGCIRMRNRDVEELFAKVRVGDVVEIHDQSDDELAAIFNTDAEQDSDNSASSAGVE